jgi:hypothetical protein
MLHLLFQVLIGGNLQVLIWVRCLHGAPHIFSTFCSRSCTCDCRCRSCEEKLRKRSKAAQRKNNRQADAVDTGRKAVASTCVAAAVAAKPAAAPVEAPTDQSGQQQQQQQQALWELLDPADGAALLDDPLLLQSEGSDMLFFEPEQQQQQTADDQGLAGLLTSWLSDDVDDATTGYQGTGLPSAAVGVPGGSAAASQL